MVAWHLTFRFHLFRGPFLSGNKSSHLMMPESKLGQSLLLGLAVIPACLLGAFIQNYWVDVPQWDQWEYVTFFKKLSVGTLTLSDLFWQQAEHRQFFPNLIFVGLGWLTRWDVRYEVVVSFLLACLVSFNVYRLGERTLGGGRARRLFIWFLANLLIFSPVQRENWLLGVQIVYFLPLACVTTCLVIAYSELRALSKLLSCMCLATISTFSAANGIVCWLILFPLLYLLAAPNGQGNGSNRQSLILIWGGGFLVNAALYLNGYQKPASQPDVASILIHPLKALGYFCTLLGNPLAVRSLIFPQDPYSRRAMIICAAAGLGLTVLFALLALSARRDSRLAYRVAGWWSLGAYSLSTALLVTIGRTGFGVGNASELRYTTFTLYLPVALIYLLPIILESRAAKASYFTQRKRLILPVLASVFVFSQLLTYPLSVTDMRDHSERFRYSKACLLFINVVQEEKGLRDLYWNRWNVGKIRSAANVLNDLGYLRPSLISSDRVRDLAPAGAYRPEGYGSFTLIRASEDEYIAAGWAMLPERGEPAHAILLTYEGVDAESVVFALSRTNDSYRQRPPHEYSHWQKSLATGDLPGDPSTIKAWAFDAQSGQAFQLPRTQVIEK